MANLTNISDLFLMGREKLTWLHIDVNQPAATTKFTWNKKNYFQIAAWNRLTIHIKFSYSFHSYKTPAVEQQNQSGNETPKSSIQEPITTSVSTAPISEPLLSEAEAAKFLGISKMTVLRKRSTGEIGYFRVGHRILYSKEKHLITFLEKCEKDQPS